MSWYYEEPKIKAVLLKHFEGMSDAQADELAEEIYSEYSLATSMEAIERSDRHPQKDIDALSRAEEQLRRAMRGLETLGWHGSKALHPHSTTLMSALRGKIWLVNDASLNSGQIFSEHLGEIADQLAEAARATPPEGASVNSAFGEGPGFERSTSKPRKTGAQRTAEKCANVYAKQESKEPTVRTDAMSNQAYGPFFEFIYDIFQCLRVDGSPETWARHAERRWKAKKK